MRIPHTAVFYQAVLTPNEGTVGSDGTLMRRLLRNAAWLRSPVNQPIPRSLTHVLFCPRVRVSVRLL